MNNFNYVNSNTEFDLVKHLCVRSISSVSVFRKVPCHPQRKVIHHRALPYVTIPNACSTCVSYTYFCMIYLQLVIYGLALPYHGNEVCGEETFV